jgi:hypothetical protein
LNLKEILKKNKTLSLSLSPFLLFSPRQANMPFSFPFPREQAGPVAQLRATAGPAQPSLPFLLLRPLTGGTRPSEQSPTFGRVRRTRRRAPPAVTGRDLHSPQSKLRN